MVINSDRYQVLSTSLRTAFIKKGFEIHIEIDENKRLEFGINLYANRCAGVKEMDKLLKNLNDANNLVSRLNAMNLYVDFTKGDDYITDFESFRSATSSLNAQILLSMENAIDFFLRESQKMQ